ncbi:MAG: ribosomal protein S18-alanine N-acetyltransferase [Firmicutes bacterium]|nr:ribosomal protein S18-alanine N-acetyltransferase [Bacillota bacterium]
MRKSDIKQVLVIEQTVFPRPWSAALYESELEQPDTRCYYVAKVGRSVIGYIGYMVVLDESHITTLAVDQKWHRNGLGMLLLFQVAKDAERLNLKAMTLEVRTANIAAQQLYFKFGFLPIGVRKNYYAEINEDAIVMWADSIQSEEYRVRLEDIMKCLEEKANLRFGLESKAVITLNSIDQ